MPGQWARRLIIFVIESQVLTQVKIGHIVFISRMTLVQSNKTLSFKLKRGQFPLTVSFCMTIHNLFTN